MTILGIGVNLNRDSWRGSPFSSQLSPLFRLSAPLRETLFFRALSQDFRVLSRASPP